MPADYQQSGIALECPGTRLARLEENIRILRGLFSAGEFDFTGEHFTITGLQGTPAPVQPGGPPILIGGGGRKILSMAARRADIIQVLGASLGNTGAQVNDLSSFHVDAFEERIGWIAEAARSRFDEIELSLMLVFVAVTDDAEASARAFLDMLTATVSRYGGTVGDIDTRLETLLDSPVVAIGTVDEICAKLRRVRDTLGFSYFQMPYGSRPTDHAAIVERLSGR